MAEIPNLILIAWAEIRTLRRKTTVVGFSAAANIFENVCYRPPFENLKSYIPSCPIYFSFLRDMLIGEQSIWRENSNTITV